LTWKNALVSVSDKTGLHHLAEYFKAHGTRVVSTGGTAKELRTLGVPVVDVSEQTGFPEVMDGRVKTLHPRVHMSLLARPGHTQDQRLLSEQGLTPFDLVVVNLYPFGREPSVEMIDVGGPSMLRAAAKNFSQITVLCDPAFYQDVLRKGPSLSLEDRRHLAAQVFSHLSAYDQAVAEWLEHGEPAKKLRYGENPQQTAHWHRRKVQGLHSARILQGKELSYNNLLDLNSALRCLKSVSSPAAVVAIKHNSPCGVGTAKDTASALQAVESALAADPKSVFGAVVALNQPVSVEMASKLSQIFLEVIVAPSYSEDALQLFAKKPDLRVLELDVNELSQDLEESRSIWGGVLRQTTDQVVQAWSPEWTVHGVSPSRGIQDDLLLAWQVCAHLKSNAIAIVKHGQTLGLGMGQVNRIDSVRQALQRWKEYHAEVQDPVLASDGFFPFPDSVDEIAAAGIRWVIQPGGSKKDPEVLASAKRHSLSMVLTKQRHFAH
jgi:phosphoribosylaminoimidazolecarboxamide formyltransferase / IMP cyclohydrolase